MTLDRDAINRAAAETQKELCLLQHPIWRVLCMKKIGHEGRHWFMVRWGSAAEAVRDATQAVIDAQTDQLFP